MVKTQALAIAHILSDKLTFIALAVVASTIVGAAGVAAADKPSQPDPKGPPAIVQLCKEHYKQLGFKNVGDCVSHLNGHGHGYGGNGDHGNKHKHHHFDFHDFSAFFHHFHFKHGH